MSVEFSYTANLQWTSTTESTPTIARIAHLLSVAQRINVRFFTSALFFSLFKVAFSAAIETRAVNAVTIDVVNAQLAPDGFERSTVVANGQFPGPAITAFKGQTLEVTVNNKLTDASMRRSTALNLDGIFFHTDNVYEEAEPFVNACPIAPESSYTYTVPLGSQAGTFWYHSELSVQYVDGFRGPLIIYDPEDPHNSLYDVDDKSTIVELADWWQNSSLPLMAGYEATGIVPVSDTGLVNGAGRFNGGPEVPWSIINVVQGKRYRLRIINESARNVFTVSIDNHNLTIIEADGELTEPLTVQKFEMFAGQRYSAVLNADQPVDNYWFNAPFVGGSPARNPHQNTTLSRAIIRYAGAPIADPTALMTSGPADGALIEADLRPLVPTPVSEPDMTLNLDFEVVAGKAIWNINNVSFLPEKVPTLERVLGGAFQPGDFNATENVIVLPANATIDVVFPPTEDDDAHPLHLHGMNFQVIKSMSSPVNNTVNPIRRDTIAVGGSGTTIRFSTNNPGPWFFHCHIYWHKQAGLATVMLADPVTVQTAVHPSKAWEALCPAYNALPEELQ
ncbi:multicopper oxidase [Macrolepiota fuliginosa MF-IS2]|uniref:Multicopper oxidase n=1 Tax=Macrolepiota fuliginosa MF-IS2 TaxID=1400762 RepID=A0A9P5XHH7_9AGAR|nr:multicopper oxidase [Macrolepiota fuliginosa MF-IS2]